MEQNLNTNTDNKVYLSAFIGVLLFIATVALARVSATTLQLSYMIVAAIMGISSLFLLANAIKNDPSRLKWKE